jgi:hypothetical protein
VTPADIPSRLGFLLKMILEAASVGGLIDLQRKSPRWRGAANLLIGRAAFETAKRMYPKDALEYRRGAQVLDRSGPEAKV